MEQRFWRCCCCTRDDLEAADRRGGRSWLEPAADAMRVTEADGLRLIGLDGMPAVEAFEAHAEDQRSSTRPRCAFAVFSAQHLRVEQLLATSSACRLSVDKDGALHMAGEVPVGSRVRIMRTSLDASLAATYARYKRSAVEAEWPKAWGCFVLRLRRHENPHRRSVHNGT